MLALAFALMLQGWAPPVVENWDCASPLIAKNYRQHVVAHLLAQRIADECAHAYTPRQIASAADSSFELSERTIYEQGLMLFTLEIEGGIERARRGDAIILKH